MSDYDNDFEEECSENIDENIINEGNETDEFNNNIDLINEKDKLQQQDTQKFQQPIKLNSNNFESLKQKHQQQQQQQQFQQSQEEEQEEGVEDSNDNFNTNFQQNQLNQNQNNDNFISQDHYSTNPNPAFLNQNNNQILQQQQQQQQGSSNINFSQQGTFDRQKFYQQQQQQNQQFEMQQQQLQERIIGASGSDFQYSQQLQQQQQMQQQQDQQEDGNEDWKQMPEIDQDYISNLQRKRKIIEKRQEERLKENQNNKELYIKKVSKTIEYLVSERNNFDKRNQLYRQDVKQNVLRFHREIGKVFAADEGLKEIRFCFLDYLKKNNPLLAKDWGNKFLNENEKLEERIGRVKQHGPTIVRQRQEIEQILKEKQSIERQIEQEELKMRMNQMYANQPQFANSNKENNF